MVVQNKNITVEQTRDMTEIFNTTVGYIFKSDKDYNRNIKTKYMLSDEKIQELKNKPIEYEIKSTDGQVFFFDGKKVTIDFEKYANLPENENSKYKDIVNSYQLLLDILNTEQLYYCPYCHVVDIVSSLAKDVEHHKNQCHVVHYDRFFWDNSAFTPEQFKELPKKTREWELNSIRKLYKPVNKSYTPIQISFAIDRVYLKLARDLGIKQFNGGYRNKYFL